MYKTESILEAASPAVMQKLCSIQFCLLISLVQRWSGHQETFLLQLKSKVCKAGRRENMPGPSAAHVGRLHPLGSGL